MKRALYMVSILTVLGSPKVAISEENPLLIRADRIIDGTSGEPIEASVFGEGLYEASVPAGDYQVVGWNADQDCFSALSAITVDPCDEIIVDLVIIDCF